jgi:hypothetical protein
VTTSPANTSIAEDPTFAGGWVQYVVGKFGGAGGKRIYALDNEPALWSSTHHDVHPARLTYDELWQRMRDYGAAIIAADPGAEISGPVEWGWPNYFCSDADDISKGCSAQSPDRAKHGGEELVAWLLDQAAAWEKANGKRLLHYLDLHYYPQGGNPPQNTRSLWDPSYVDPSWINDKIRLIPRMHGWVDQHYPGTKLLVSEYDWGHHNDALGAITYAEVLGIFAREGLDAATAWGAPAANEMAFGAWKLYLDYDGGGAQFETTYAETSVSAAGVQAFAAVGATRATVALINEGNAAVTIDVALKSFQPAGNAKWFMGSGLSITAQKDVAANHGVFPVTLPAMSYGMMQLDGVGPMFADMAVLSDMASPADLGTEPDLIVDLGYQGWGDDPAGGQAGGCGCALGTRIPPTPNMLLAILAMALLARRRAGRR